jgi:hypothetical protein
MAKLKLGKSVDGYPSDSFDFEVYPFFGLSIERSKKEATNNQFYWRVGNRDGTQLLSFDVFKESGLISGVELIAYSGKLMTFLGFNQAYKKSDARFLLIRESEQERKVSNSIVDATDHVHEISFSVSGNKVQLGFFDAPPEKGIQISPSLILLIDSEDIVVGVEVGNVPAEEITRMANKLSQ